MTTKLSSSEIKRELADRFAMPTWDLSVRWEKGRSLEIAVPTMAERLVRDVQEFAYARAEEWGVGISEDGDEWPSPKVFVETGLETPAKYNRPKLSASVIKKELSDRFLIPFRQISVRWGSWNSLDVKLPWRSPGYSELDEFCDVRAYAESRCGPWGCESCKVSRAEHRPVYPCPSCGTPLKCRRFPRLLTAKNIDKAGGPPYRCEPCRVQLLWDGEICNAPKYRSLDA